MRRAFEYAAVAARRGGRPARRGRRARATAATCTRGRGRAGSASRAGPRWRSQSSSPATASSRELTGTPLPLPARVDRRGGRAGPRREARGACRSPRSARPAPLHAHRRRVRQLRPDVQDEPAAARRRRTSRRCRPAWPTARSTPSPPTTRRTPPRPRTRPFEEAPPGMLGVETALGRHAHRARRAGRAIARATRSALLSWRPAARRRPRRRRHGGPVAAGRPAHLVVIDPAATWTVDPARLASKARNTPYAGPDPHRPGAPHRAGRGSRCVLDGEAQR